MKELYLNIMGRVKLFLTILVIASPAFASAQVRDTFIPLQPGAIQLNGYLEHDIQNSLIHWNMGKVPYASLVKTFREGRDFFAQGEMWGKAVRSGAMFYRYTQDPKLKQILKKTVADLLTTQRSNGCISASKVSNQPDGPGGDLWERTYVLLGLERYYSLVEQDPKVLQAMIDEANCTLSQIGPPPKVSILDQGWSPNHIESSTILEPIMRLYNITEYKRYLDFATYIVQQGGAKGHNVIKQAHNDVLPYKMGGTYPKAYEMMSLFEGLIEYYRVTSDEYVKQAIFNLYQNIRTHEITIIGNGGGDQPYHPDVYGEAWDNTAFEQTNPDIQRMMETCVGVTWLKLNSQMLRLTGDPLAVDEIGKYVYNGLIGAMKPTGDGFSYVNLLNGTKTNPEGWGGMCNGVYCTCCNLNGPMGLAYIPYLVAMNSETGPVINLYNAATINTNTPNGHNVELDIITNYPKSGVIKIQVMTQKPEQFDIKLRIPSWSKHTSLTVNGRELGTTSGEFKVIKRSWSAGDSIMLKLDMRCRLIAGPHGSNNAGDDYQALIRGPVVLSRDENIDSNYNKPVNIISTNGYVDVKREPPFQPQTRVQVRVPTKGGAIHMIDYASVNNWNGKHINTWLPIRK